MKTYVALFRGINVGGRNILPMKDLTVLLEGLGCRDVSTFIQSGNVVLKHDSQNDQELGAEIASAVQDAFGFKPAVLLLTTGELEKAAAGNPFPDGELEPSKLHLSFLMEPPDAGRIERARALLAPSEAFAVKGRVAYLHAPNGIGRSKIAAGLERALGVGGTGRNWRTVSRLRELAATIDP
jgi:uncharacterized protein (DUF1697 family)